MLISLVGLPGSGKSTIGRRLSRRFDLTFLDADREIEREAGCRIPELFSREGEERFRDLEERVIDTLLRRDGGVVATGGGAVLRETNRRVLRERSIVVYLRCRPDELVSRVRDDGRRPLLAGGDVAGKLDRLFASRDPLYAGIAHVVVEGEQRQFPRVVAALAPRLRPVATPAAP